MRLTPKRPKKKVIRHPYARYKAVFRTFFLPFLPAALVLGLLYAIWISSIPGQMYNRIVALLEKSSVTLGLTLSSVYVEGRDQTRSDEILSAAALTRGTPMFFLDLNQIRQALETLPWIRSAVVYRDFPSTIHIHLVERHPTALWRVEKKTFLVDREGHVLTPTSPEAFQNLPTISGKGAAQNVGPLFEIIGKFSDLQQHLKSANYVGNRRWDLILENGVKVLLPEHNTLQALEAFQKISPSPLLHSTAVKLIDLRVPERLIIQVTPEVNLRLRSKGVSKET